MDTDTPAQTTTVKPFAQFLQEQRAGVLHDELSEQLQALVASVQEHGKSGKLTLTINVAQNDDGMTLTLTDDVTIKPARAARGGALFYADDAGNLTRRDPRQPELPLRRVDGGTGEVIDTPNEATS